MRFNWEDTSALSYQYQAFGIEQRSNELRFLYDSNVVLRLPDRLIPPGNRQYDFLHDLDRSPMKFYIAQFTLDGPKDAETMYSSWRSDFENAMKNGWAGCKTIDGRYAAHKLVDYVRVWDVPAGTPIPNFPH